MEPAPPVTMIRIDSPSDLDSAFADLSVPYGSISSPNVNFTLVLSGCVLRSTVKPTFQQSLRGYTDTPRVPSVRLPFLME